MAARSWLDIMAEDSNISMTSITSITSITSGDQISKDPEFDNSKQGVNLLFNKNVIICDDSQSRKRTFKEMESQQTKHQQIESNKENDKFLPPKAKQRTNVNGDWKKRKRTENINVSNNKIGFGRFLNWANNDKSNDNDDNDKILRNKINDNERNICHLNKNGNNGSNSNLSSNSKLIICGSSINQNRGRRRKQIRARRNNKKNISNINDENVNKTNNMTKIIEEEEEEEDNDNDNDNDEEKEELSQEIKDDEEEDDDLKINVKQRRITPILENVVFDTNLILNKVPILKKKLNCDTLQGPIFLNADQYEKLNENEIEKEEEEEDDEEDDEDYDCDVWGRNSLINNNNNNNNNKINWANKLFGSQIKENKKLKQKQEELLINQRKEERKHEMKIESLLPPKSIMFSRESSLSINTDNSSPRTSIIKPSIEATEWREKQILIGKNTIGYKNFDKKYPNKELKFRTSNNFIMTPDSKDKVGKKRWVGKYQKWRKFLHRFTDSDNENDDK